MVSRDLTGFTEANLVDSADSELVLSVIHQACHQEFGGLELFRDIALGPVLRVSSLTLHQVADDLTATVVRRFGPAKADGALGGVHHLGEGRWAGRIWRIMETLLLLLSNFIEKKMNR